MPLPETQRDKAPGTGHPAVLRLDSRFLLSFGPARRPETRSDYMRPCRARKRGRRDPIIRIYTNKPRTTGEGYKGMVHQPDPAKEANLEEGIYAIRRLHIRGLREYRLPAADEMLYPENFAYLSDVLSYHAVGARSVENQQHRLTASGIDMPVGMKSPTSGDLSVMLNSIQAAQSAHTFIYHGHEVQTTGNPLAHGVLRGAVDPLGRHIPNYHYEDLERLAAEYAKRGLRNPASCDTNIQLHEALMSSPASPMSHVSAVRPPSALIKA